MPTSYRELMMLRIVGRVDHQTIIAPADAIERLRKLSFVPLLSDQQLGWLVEGEIHTLHFDRDMALMTYSLATQPGSRVSAKVPDSRITEWETIREQHDNRSK